MPRILSINSEKLKKDARGSEPFVSEMLRDKKIMIIGDEDELRKISKG